MAVIEITALQPSVGSIGVPPNVGTRLLAAAHLPPLDGYEPIQRGWWRRVDEWTVSQRIERDLW